MKKILIIGLALIMCMGMAFADPLLYTLNLKAEVVGLPDSGDDTFTGDDPTPDFDADGLQGWLYYDKVGNGVLGSKDKSNLEQINPDVNTGASVINLSGFDLNGGPGYTNLYLYVAAGENTKGDLETNPQVTVTYASPNGWELIDPADDLPYTIGEANYKNIPIAFKTDTVNYTALMVEGFAGEPEDKETPLIAVSGKAESVSFTAMKGTNTKDSAILSKTTLSWDRNADTQAGDYLATVTITVSEGQN